MQPSLEAVMSNSDSGTHYVLSAEKKTLPNGAGANYLWRRQSELCRDKGHQRCPSREREVEGWAPAIASR